MAENDEKLRQFLEAITDKTKRERETALREVEERNRAAFEAAEKEPMANAHRIIERKIQEVRNSIFLGLSKRESESKKKLLAKRVAVEEEIFKRAETKLLDFVNTPAYKAYLVRCAKKAAEIFSANPAATVFYIRAEDVSFKSDIESAFGSNCSFAESPEIKIGGLIAVNEELGRVINASICTELEEQRAWFEETSGLSVCP
ncbi:MAG: hypothetical protein LBL82_06055 [Oscillospiraceae bacterium]|jgi:vacuolar-type H+-ATPase subunit E/Vma4|nr:hypothetical protein [Oscillospiraceae bacterium]